MQIAEAERQTELHIPPWGAMRAYSVRAARDDDDDDGGGGGIGGDNRNTRTYTPTPALHRPISSRAKSPSTRQARPGGREPRERKPTSHPPSREITATASLSCMWIMRMVGYWGAKPCSQQATSPAKFWK